MIYAASKEDLATVIKMAEKAYLKATEGKDNLPSFDPIAASLFIVKNWSVLPIFVFKDEETKEILGCLGLHWIAFPWSEEQVMAEYFRWSESKEVESSLTDSLKDLAKLNKVKYAIKDQD